MGAGGPAGRAAVLSLPEHAALPGPAAPECQGPQRGVHQDHHLPPGPQFRHRQGPLRRRRERQGGDGADGAARPLRRAEQHRLVHGAGGGRLSHHLWTGKPEVPCQAVPDHPAGAGRSGLHRPDRHGQLQRKDQHAVYRLLHDDRRSRHHPGRGKLLREHAHRQQRRGI